MGAPVNEAATSNEADYLSHRRASSWGDSGSTAISEALEHLLASALACPAHAIIYALAV